MNKRAILVGTQQYHMLGDLKYARNDAVATGKALQRYCNFQPGSITLMTCQAEGGLNAHSSYIEQALDNLRQEQLDQQEPLELLIFGFWGHGVASSPGQRYLCGVETMEHRLESTALSLQLVQAKLKQIPARNTLIILDCCQNRPVGRSTSSEPIGTGEQAALDSMARDIKATHIKHDPNLSPTVAVLSACGEGEKAYEWEERQHGIFTAHFLDGLRSGKSGIADLAQFTRQQVSRTARDLFHQSQTPKLMLEGGDIRLAPERPKAKRKVRQSAPADSQKEQRAKQNTTTATEQSAKPTVDPKKLDPDSIPVLAGTRKKVESAHLQLQKSLSAHQQLKQQIAGKVDLAEVENHLRQNPQSNATSLLKYKPDNISRSDFTRCVSSFGKVLASEHSLQQARREFTSQSKRFIINFLQQNGCLTKQDSFPERHLLQLVAQLAQYSSVNEDAIWQLAETAHSEYWDAQQLKSQRHAASMKFLAGLITVLLVFSLAGFLIYRYATHDSRMRVAFAKKVNSTRSSEPADRISISIDGVEYAFRWCPPGSFQMGSASPDAAADEKPVHQVRLTSGFWMMETEVTQKMYKEVIGDNPSRFSGFGKSNHPVEKVSWDDANRFCKKLSQQIGFAVRLPTEAEWEYACRAGSDNKFYWGDNESEKVVSQYCWYIKNSKSSTHPVAQKKPNDFGLYDMSGNVYEWCSDWYDGSFYGTSLATTNLEGPESGSNRVCRGGSWHHGPGDCRSANRLRNEPGNRNDSLGFRVVLLPVPSSSEQQ